MKMKYRNILVLGIGNLLLHDEGIGIHALRDLENHYKFSDNVTLMDGGTLGMRLLDHIEQADYLIVADTFCSNKPPGTLTRLSMAELESQVAAKNSMHQVSFLDTLSHARLLGILPETILVGCEPENLNPWGEDLTPSVEAAKPKMVKMIIREIRKAGGKVIRIRETG